MTKASLNPDQLRMVEIIEALGFGAIEGLLIRDGLPCYELEHCVVQAIKLDSARELQPDPQKADLTLKIEFERLFSQLSLLREGLVDIDVRHRVPLRLVVRRRYKDLSRACQMREAL
ncbi:MAG: hypothetical protein WBW33_26980 [Bryobacteraceae bacterium]